MVSRYTGACLGLLAFAVAILAGMLVHNSLMVTLSRALVAMVVFCALGLIVGAVAQSVINEHYRRREAQELAPADQDTGGGGTEEAPEDETATAEVAVVLP